MKHIIKPLIIATCLLAIPLIASLFVDGWNWSPFDYLFAWTLFAGIGSAYVLISRRSDVSVYKGGLALALLGVFLLIWINGAVGIIGDEEPFNFVYLGVIAIGVIGAGSVKFHPQGMSRVLSSMAILIMLIPFVALMVSPETMREEPGIFGVFVLNLFFVLVFSGAALLFKQAAPQK